MRFRKLSRRPESGLSRINSHKHLSIIADVQLHNRADLLRSLGPGLQVEHPNDTLILLAAYEKWGERCGNFLLGEFSFAIWDDRLKRLFCCRDHMGFRAFLYWQTPTRFIFSNRISLILECPGVPRELNRRKLASMSVPSGHHMLAHEETFPQRGFSLSSRLMDDG